MTKKKGEMIPGKRYRGWGFLNEYREFCFEPEETGSREGVIKQIISKDGVSLSETKGNLLIRVKVAKEPNKAILVSNILRKVNSISKLIYEYDI